MRDRGAQLREQLAELPGVVEVRGRGFMLAAELDPSRAEPATALVGRALPEERLVLNATGPATLRILPPLTITDAELDDGWAGSPAFCADFGADSLDPSERSGTNLGFTPATREINA